MKKYNVEDLTADTLFQMVQEVNSWDGSLEEYEYYVNDEEFFNTFYQDRPMEAVRAALHGDYRYMDDYVRMTSVLNLESCSEWELESELLEDAEEIAEVYAELVTDGHIENVAGLSIESEQSYDE